MRRVVGLVTAHPRIVVVLAAALPALALAAWFRVGPPGVLDDYEVFRWVIGTWRRGGDLVGMEPVTAQGEPLPWVYPPFALLPLSLVCVGPFVLGISLLTAASMLAVGGTCYLVIRHMWPGTPVRDARTVAAALVPLTLVLEPVGGNYGLGQINAVVMALVALDCLSPNPRWPRGVLIGLAAAVKLTPAAFVLFFLFRRDLKAAATVAVTFVAATAVGFAVDARASVDYWLGTGPAASVSGSPLRVNQSVLGALARLDLPSAVAVGVWVVLGLVLLAAVVRGMTRRAQPVDAPLAMVVVALLALLVSPTSWSVHWVWVVPGLLVMAGHAVRGGSARWWALAAATTLTAMLPVFSWLPGKDGRELGWEPWQHLVGNTYPLLGIVLIGLFAAAPARTRGTVGRARESPAGTGG